jgi:hypothetical protein
MTMWAKVSADGELLSASRILEVEKVGRGRYELRADGDLMPCSLIGTVNNQGFNPFEVGPGSSSILVGLKAPDRLFVRTATPSAGSPEHVDADRPFSVAVFGPRD